MRTISSAVALNLYVNTVQFMTISEYRELIPIFRYSKIPVAVAFNSYYVL